MKKIVPSYEKHNIDTFLKKYNKTGEYIGSTDGDVLRVDNNDYWLDEDEGNWYSNAKGFENKGYGPIRNLLFDSLGLAPQLRALYAKYGAPIEDIPENANRNILRLYGDRRLNTYKNLIKDNASLFFPNEEVPEDALDDYEVESSSPYYISLEDLIDSDLDVNGVKELKDAYKEAILKDKRAELNSSMSKKEAQEILDGISHTVPKDVMTKLNSNVVNTLIDRM